MSITTKPSLHHRRMPGTAVSNLGEIPTRNEEKWEGEVVRGKTQRLHSVIEVKRKWVLVPGGGEAAEHDVESVGIGFGDLGEEGGGVREVLEVDEFGEEEVGFVDGVDEHLGVDLFELFDGEALFQEVQELSRVG